MIKIKKVKNLQVGEVTLDSEKNELTTEDIQKAGVVYYIKFSNMNYTPFTADMTVNIKEEGE